MPRGGQSALAHVHRSEYHALAFARFSRRVKMGLLLGIVVGAAQAEEAATDTAVDVQAQLSAQAGSILRNYCIGCHAEDEPEGDLIMTSREALLIGGEKAGPSIIPGDPANSPFIAYIRGDRSPRMPKKEPPLVEDSIRVLEAWVLAGASFAGIDETTFVLDEKAAQVAAARKANLSLPDQTQTKVAEDEVLIDPLRPQKVIERRRERFALVPAPARPPACAGLVNNPIDNFVNAKTEKAGLGSLSNLCADSEFVRRVHLDVLGVIPKGEEAAVFVNDTDPEKRKRLIETLLARDAEYAAEWVAFWEEALCSSKAKIRIYGQRGDYRDWIFESFKANKPYDIWVTELVDPAMPGHPGKYILNDVMMNTLQSASNTAQVFLGTAMKCATCHNHFENEEWPQKRFFGFAGLFQQADLELVRCNVHTGELIKSKFPFDLPDTALDIPQGASYPERVTRLAQLLVDPTNARFSQTIVNRLWKRYMGHGLIEPADDFRESRPGSHPDLLEWLAYDFMSQDYDLKRTISLILNSRTYQQKHNPQIVDILELGNIDDDRRYFRSPPLRRLSAEQTIESIAMALGHQWGGDLRLFRQDHVTPFMSALGRPLTHDSVSTSRSDTVAVVQGLQLLNSEEYNQKIHASAVVRDLAEQFQNSEVAKNEVIGSIYTVALSRQAAPNEIQLTSQFIDKRLPGSTVADAIGDVFWALFTSPEFQYIH